MNRISIFAGLLLLSGGAMADQLLVTESAKGASRAVGIDYVSSGSAVAFDFRIAIPGGESARVDLSKCVADLPKSHSGQCSFVKGEVIGVVYNDSNLALPKGALRVGSISINTISPDKASVAHFLAADKDANKIESTTFVSADK